MTATQTVLLVVGVILVVGAVVLALSAGRRAALRRRFGPEYERALADNDDRTRAERELRDRERRHAELELRPLDDAIRDGFAQRWRSVQARFVSEPEAAVVAGDELVTQLAAARGYPTSGFDDQAAYLSVEHARTLGHYRDAHEIYLRGQRGQASTEELRQALVHYRVLIADMLDESPSSMVDTPPASTTRQGA